MKKIVKKFLTIACTLVLCLVCLTGCSWLEIDRQKYYNDVVVSIGNKNFYKKDLIEAFSNYGYQYYESYGYGLEESVNYTIGSMIDRWLLLEEVKKDEAYKITDEEMLEIKQEAFDYMQDSIFTFETKVREEWDLTVDTEEGKAEETSTLRATEEEYFPSTYYEVVEETINGETVLVGKVFRVEGHSHDHIVVGDIKLTDHFDKSRQVVTDKKVSDEAWARYVKSLQDGAKGEGRCTDESAVLLFEENRLIELLTNNLYLEKYEHAFMDSLEIDTETVLAYYRDQYKAQKELYSVNETLYHTAMKEASSKYTYYHPNSGNEYVNTKHILINFTDVQKEAIKALNTRYDVTNDGSEEDEKRKENTFYQNELKAIINQTTTTFEAVVNGEKQTFTWNALVGEDNVYDFVTGYVTGSTLEERCEQFNECVYMFNDDTGFMNSEFDYVVNLDTSVTDQMVKPFADGVRALDKSNGGEGEGSMNYIVSEYGIHIIFHAGNAKNLIEEKNIDNISDEELLRILCNTYTTPESGKSIFNYIYDTLKLEENAYDVMTQNKINTARTELKNNGIQIVYYEKNYKDLWA